MIFLFFQRDAPNDVWTLKNEKNKIAYFFLSNPVG
jgi:hypothetical protein